MICPACDRELAHLDAGGGIFLDVCQGGCGGVWFDNFELQKFDEAHELVSSPVFGVEPAPGTKDRQARTVGKEAAKRLCPRCPGQKMQRKFFSAKRQIEVDECPNCAGDWLDDDELEKIRGEFANAAEREEAAQDLFSQMFDAKLDDMRKQSQERVRKADNFNKAFKRLFGFGRP